jgi:hypothetical protein
MRRINLVELIDTRPANTPNDALKDAHARSRYHFEEVGANTLRIEGEGLPRPTAILESSPGRLQMWWRLDSEVAPEIGEELNRRLAYAMGADKSGWDLTELLRVPGTRNHKYPERPTVRRRGPFMHSQICRAWLLFSHYGRDSRGHSQSRSVAGNNRLILLTRP